MTKVSFKYEPDKFLTLFPENIFDKIDKNHPAKLVEMVVNQLDIKDILQKYKGGRMFCVSSSYDDKNNLL